MIGERELRIMRPDAMLINTCRGELVDEDALYSVLQERKIAGYGTDAVEGEPIDRKHRLVSLPNAVVLPHMSGHTVESVRDIGETMVRDCERVFVERTSPGVLANPEVIKKGLRTWR